MRPLSRSLGPALLACAALLAALAAPARAWDQGEWRLPAHQLAGTLRTPRYYGGSAVAAGPDGSATALVNRWSSSESALLSVDRAPGGEWGEATQMSTGARPTSPQISIDQSSGTQVAGWLDSASGSAPFTVWVSRRASGGGPWQAPVELASYGGPEDQIVGAPAIAQDSTGDVLVVWVEATGSWSSEWLVAAEWSHGSWGPSQRISTPVDGVLFSEDTALVSDGPGDFVLGWTSSQNWSEYSAVTETLTREGGWSGEEVLDTEPDFLYGLSVSANTAGQGAMVWADASTATVQAAALQSGAWSVSNPPETQIHVVCENAPPQVGTDATGTSMALWTEADGRVRSERMAAGGAWQRGRATLGTISETSRDEMRIAVAGDGSALAGWTSYETEPPYGSTVQADAEPAGASWRAPATLAPASDGYAGQPSLSLGAGGTGVISWVGEHEVPTSGETEWDSIPRAALFEGSSTKPATGTPSSNATVPGAPAPAAAPRRLGAVYVQSHKHRLWLARGGHVVTTSIRNTNAFPVSGTARVYEYLLAHGERAHSSARELAALVHYRLAAHETKKISFRIGRRALHRLHALVPDRGHILVDVRLTIEGEGQSARSAVVMALDEPLAPHRGKLRRPKVPAGYPAPVDPWARKAC